MIKLLIKLLHCFMKYGLLKESKKTIKASTCGLQACQRHFLFAYSQSIACTRSIVSYSIYSAAWARTYVITFSIRTTRTINYYASICTTHISTRVEYEWGIVLRLQSGCGGIRRMWILFATSFPRVDSF